jgi:hypothetical protein
LQSCSHDVSFGCALLLFNDEKSLENIYINILDLYFRQNSTFAIFKTFAIFEIFSLAQKTIHIQLVNFIGADDDDFQKMFGKCARTVDEIATRKQILHAASCMQSRQFFASTLPEQLYELKNEDAI